MCVCVFVCDVCVWNTERKTRIRNSHVQEESQLIGVIRFTLSSSTFRKRKKQEKKEDDEEGGEEEEEVEEISEESLIRKKASVSGRIVMFDLAMSEVFRTPSSPSSSVDPTSRR